MLSNLSLPWWAYALMGTGLCVFIALIAITVHRNRGMHRSLFASPYALWMMIFTIVPVILIAYYAFTDSSGAFTLDNFRSFWDSNYESNKIILDAMGEAGQAYISRGTVNVDTLVYSLWMAFQCTLICLLLGYPAALIMADREIKLGPTLVVLFIIPMWMNFLLRTIAWMSLLEDNGLINTVLRALGFNGVQLMYNSGGFGSLSSSSQPPCIHVCQPCFSASRQKSAASAKSGKSVAKSAFASSDRRSAGRRSVGTVASISCSSCRSADSILTAPPSRNSQCEWCAWR